MPHTADAVIIGGGVMGCSILYNLACRGVTDTVLLERDVLASGSTGRSQAILRMHYSNEVTTRLAWDSLAVFRDFTEIVGVPSGYTKTGYFIIVGPEDRDAMMANVHMQRSVGVDTSTVTAEDVREIAPMVEPGEGESFAYEPDSGYADPYSVTTGYANAARESGARVMSGTPAAGIEITAGKGDRGPYPEWADRDLGGGRRRGALGRTSTRVDRSRCPAASHPPPGDYAPQTAGRRSGPPDHRGRRQRHVPAPGHRQSDPHRRGRR